MDAATRAVLNETENLLIAGTRPRRARGQTRAAGARQQTRRDSKRAAAR
jgi:hypothetical protein